MNDMPAEKSISTWFIYKIMNKSHRNEQPPYLPPGNAAALVAGWTRMEKFVTYVVFLDERAAIISTYHTLARISTLLPII